MLSCDCCVALPRGAMGLSAVCDSDIFQSYSLFWVSFVQTAMALSPLGEMK